MSVASNIWKLFLVRTFNWFMVVIPVYVLFVQSHGLSLAQVFLLQGVFSLSVFLFEVPSGYFADVMGRRRSIVAGVSLEFLGFFMYSITSGFFPFLIAEVVIALGAAFISGADSALLYDSLVELGRDGEYKKLEGRQLAIGNFSEAAASVVGGLLAVYSLQYTMVAQAAVMFFAIPIAFTLVESSRNVMDVSEGHWKALVRVVRFSLQGHSQVKWLLLASSFIALSTFTVVWLVQPYSQQVGVPLVWFGIVWAVLNASVGVFSWFAHDVEAWLGRRNALLVLMMLPVLAYFALSQSLGMWGLLFLLPFYFVRGVHQPVILDYLNRFITGDMRATVLSVKSMLMRFEFAVLGPMLGWVADVYSLSAALMMSGGLCLVLMMISWAFLRKHRVV